MHEFGFIGASYVAASIYQDDQELINWYPEIDPTKKEGERAVVSLYPTPGLLTRASLTAASQVRGLYTPTGGNVLLAACGNKLSSISAAFVETQVGTLSSASGPVSISDNGVSAYIVDGNNRYTYNLNTGAFGTAPATDGAFTGGDKVDIVDTFLFYNRPGTTQWGCTNAGSAISGGLNVGSKDSAPDNLVSLIAINRDVRLIGERTSEIWTNIGAFPFPFAKLSGTLRQHGSIAAFSLARLGEGAAWVSRDDRGQAVVVMSVGYELQRISTFAVETALASYSRIDDAIAYSYQQAGHEFYVLNFPAADVTWAYDLATGLWHKRAWRDSLGVYHRHRGNCSALFQGQIIVGDWQNGKLYQLSQSTYTDDGAALPCLRRCAHLTTGLRRQFFHDLQIQFQPGVGLQSGQGSDPQAMLRWSDDGGSTWSNEHWTGIGKVGKYKNRAIWRRLGQARDRIFEVVVTDPVYRVAVSAELNASEGGS